MNRVPMRLLRVIETAPPLLASTVMTWTVPALVPAPFGLLGAMAYASVVIALALGRFERAAMLTIGRAREPRPDELAALTALLTDVGEGHDWFHDVYVARRTDAQPVALRGRRSLVVSKRWIGSVERSPDDAADAVSHAVGRHQAQGCRCDLAIATCLAPWHAIASMGGKCPRPLRRMWRLRGVAAVACVIQSTTDGHPAAGLMAACVVVLTYLTPLARNEVELRVQQAADAFVAEQGAARSASPRPLALVKA